MTGFWNWVGVMCCKATRRVKQKTHRGKQQPFCLYLALPCMHSFCSCYLVIHLPFSSTLLTVIVLNDRILQDANCKLNLEQKLELHGYGISPNLGGRFCPCRQSDIAPAAWGITALVFASWSLTLKHILEKCWLMPSWVYCFCATKHTHTTPYPCFLRTNMKARSVWVFQGQGK